MPFDATAFKQAESNFDYDEPPSDGEYDVAISDTDIFTAKSTGAQYAKIHWKVLSGPGRDHTWGSIHTLEALNAKGEPNGGLAVTKELMRNAGVDVDHVNDIAELRRELEKAIGRMFALEVARKGQFVNVRIQRTLGGAAPAPSTYGQPPQGNGMLGPDEVRKEPEQTGQSDVPGVAPGEFEHPPQKGDIDPATGLPIPF